ncbi:hypothetical protein [Micromonospora zamorensis]|uniref:Ig-like domain-containing protein n=1 Tax=Micromonospora zamorensis TaxID=709883 RepID=A0ABZ1PB35_9ACTN
MSDRPRLLPLLTGTRHGTRDAMTCLYRCGTKPGVVVTWRLDGGPVGS